MTSRSSNRLIGWLGATACALIAGNAFSQDVTLAAQPDESASRLKAWHESMSRAKPAVAGCFHTEYPSTTWESVPCGVAPPHRHHAPSLPGLGIETVGGPASFLTASLPTNGPIFHAIGSFGTSAITSENLNGTVNDFSVQMNSNRFMSPACNGVSGCAGWQQYIFENSPMDGRAHAVIEYWIFGYFAGQCPSSDFRYVAGTATTAAGCVKDSPVVWLPLQPISNLTAISIDASALAGQLDQNSVSVGTAKYLVSMPDSVLTASAGWTSSEFNVYGDYNGAQATFGSGTVITLKLALADGVNTSLLNTNYGIGGSTTAETNNLNFGIVCGYLSGIQPYILYQENLGGSPLTACPTAPPNLPAPNVTVTGPTVTAGGVERFSFSWPSVAGATYYIMSVNGAESQLTGNTTTLGIRCQQSAFVTFDSCNAAGCGPAPVTVLNAANTDPCN